MEMPSSKTSMEEPLLQPAVVLSKCRATRLFPPGSSTALSRVIKSQGMGSVLGVSKEGVSSVPTGA